MSDHTRRDRYTARGGPRVEAEIGRLAKGVGDVVRSQSDRRHLRALVLIGGYGRGEGGVEIRDGRERPHNNLDFLLITRGLSGRQRSALAERLDGPTERLRAQAGVGLDLSVVPESRLRVAPSLVMWYDARYGHRTVLGDTSFLPSRRRFRVDRIPPIDVLNLLVNRGTLLVINDCLLDLGASGYQLERTLLKHWMKAVIGYGDALLFRRGAYHWSYQEKQRRFQRLPDLDPRLVALYDEALEFRFEPDYSVWDKGRLLDRIREGRHLLESVHLDFESWRLQSAELDWASYLSTATAELASRGLLSPRSAARKLQMACRRELRQSGVTGLGASLGARCASRRERLSLVYPALAYPGAFAALHALLPAWLEVPQSRLSTPSEARKRYLALWGEAGDQNFHLVARSLGLDTHLEEAA